MSHAIAVRRSAEVRQHRRRIYDAIIAGHSDAREIVMDPPDVIAGVRAFRFLEQISGSNSEWTRTRVSRLNAQAAYAQPPVNLLQQLGDMTERQRRWVADHLDDVQPKPVRIAQAAGQLPAAA